MLIDEVKVKARAENREWKKGPWEKKIVGLYLDQNTPRFDRNFINEDAFLALSVVTNPEERQSISDNIVMNNLCLIHHIIGKTIRSDTREYCNRVRITYDEIFSEGIYALIKAVKTYDVSKGVRFATYMSRIVQNEVLMMMRSLKRTINVDSLDEPIFFDSDNNPLYFTDVLFSEESFFDESILNEHYETYLLQEFGKVLTQREREIIRLYYVGTRTQKSVAEELGISQSYISRLLKRISRKGNKIHRKLQHA